MLLGRQFNKLLRKSRSNVQNKSFDINSNQDYGRKGRTEEHPIQEKGAQFHECEGYGHIGSECATYLKKQRKGLSMSWTKEESKSDHEEESAKQVTALAGICNSDGESNDGELTFEELTATYQE